MPNIPRFDGNWIRNAADLYVLDEPIDRALVAAGSIGQSVTVKADGTLEITTVSGGGGGGAVLFDSTLGSSAASIDTGAGGIAGGYKILEAWGLVRTTEAVAVSSSNIILNNDTGNNYDRQFVRGADTTTSAAVGTAQANWGFFATGSTADANAFHLIRLTILGYADSVAQKIAEVVDGNAAATVSTRKISAQAASWRSTSPITRMALRAGSGSLVAGCRLLILGR